MRGLSTPHSVDESSPRLRADSTASSDAASCWTWGSTSVRSTAVSRRAPAGPRSPRRVRSRPPEPPSRGRCWAAVLGGGAGTVLSHFTAAALWEPDELAALLSTSACPGARGDCGWVTWSRTGRGRCRPTRSTTHDGLPVTTVARTLVDLAAVARENDLEHAVEQAERQSRFDLVAVQAVLARSHGRRRASGPFATSSLRWAGPGSHARRWRIAFRAICRRADLPMPLTNAAVLPRRRSLRAGFPLARPSPDRGDRRLRHATRRSAAFVRDRRARSAPAPGRLRGRALLLG